LTQEDVNLVVKDTDEKHSADNRERNVVGAEGIEDFGLYQEGHKVG
jgi:hypothetical protein